MQWKGCDHERQMDEEHGSEGIYTGLVEMPGTSGDRWIHRENPRSR
jgi:hypothetical protein